MRWKVAILTTGLAAGREHEDTSAQVIRELVEEELKGAVVDYRIIPGEMDEVMASLIEMADYHEAELILTIGGTSLLPGDVTPEATRKVIDKEVPGLGELMRVGSSAKSASVVWHRGIAGVRGRTLIINLPGSPKGVHECLEGIMPHLPLGLSMIAGEGA